MARPEAGQGGLKASRRFNADCESVSLKSVRCNHRLHKRSLPKLYMSAPPGPGPLIACHTVSLQAPTAAAPAAAQAPIACHTVPHQDLPAASSSGLPGKLVYPHVHFCIARCESSVPPCQPIPEMGCRRRTMNYFSQHSSSWPSSSRFGVFVWTDSSLRVVMHHTNFFVRLVFCSRPVPALSLISCSSSFRPATCQPSGASDSAGEGPRHVGAHSQHQVLPPDT